VCNLVGVREADNTLRIYLDGNLYATVAGLAGICREDRPLWIWRHSSYVNAAVADIGVRDQALTAEQQHDQHRGEWRASVSRALHSSGEYGSACCQCRRHSAAG